MLSLLRQRRWVGLTFLVVALVLLCYRLAHWQLDRLHGREAANASITAAEKLAPIPPEQLLAVGRQTSSAHWRQLTVTGTWDADHQLLVRNRPQDGSNGFWVLTPLTSAQGTALLVVRGWVPYPMQADQNPDVPAPQPGQVTGVVRVQGSEPAKPTQLPTGQVLRVNVPSIAKDLPYPVYGDYADLVSEQPQPASAPTPLPAPTLDNGPHLSYAMQWYAFGVVAIVGWFVLLRRDAQAAAQDRAAAAEAAAADEHTVPTPG
ncbi:MAG TPA: SURF1 family protein [Actinomycetes bacterium]